jgi:hypothetical protein
LIPLPDVLVVSPLFLAVIMFCPSVDPEDIRLDHLEWSPVSERSEQIEEWCCDDTTRPPRAR